MLVVALHLNVLQFNSAKKIESDVGEFLPRFARAALFGSVDVEAASFLPAPPFFFESSPMTSMGD